MDAWKRYRRKGVTELRPYVPGENLTGISVAATDNPEEEATRGFPGFIARNPNNHADQWYVNLPYFLANMEAEEE